MDRFGLDEIDQKIMLTVLEKYGGGPVGLNTIAASIDEEPDTIEEVYEPYLIQLGFSTARRAGAWPRSGPSNTSESRAACAKTRTCCFEDRLSGARVEPGRPRANLAEAIALLEEAGVRVLRRIAIYETEPRDVLDQPWFLNQVVEVETDLFPRQLLDCALEDRAEDGAEAHAAQGTAHASTSTFCSTGTQ